jgi:NADH dehydrogenase
MLYYSIPIMNIQKYSEKHIVIAGAGFAGIQTVLELLERDIHGSITLINNSPYFTYYPGLHKILSDQNRGISQIALSDLFSDRRVTIIVDDIVGVDSVSKTVTLKNSAAVTGDILVLALGGETEYYNTPGLREHSYSMKSYPDALHLRRHIVEIFESYSTGEKTHNIGSLCINIVGGGPLGVDTAGELALWTNKLAKLFRVPKKLVSINLIDSSKRLLPMLSESAAEKVLKRLTNLGIRVMLEKRIMNESGDGLCLSDIKIDTDTVIWTAGVRANSLYEKITGLIVVGNKKRIQVDDFLCATPSDDYHINDVYIAGDGAEAAYSGLAQTAIAHGEYIGKSIIKKLQGVPVLPYDHKSVAYHIGVGHGWAVMKLGRITLYGFFAHIMRTFIDLRYFLSILSFKKVWELYHKKKEL